MKFVRHFIYATLNSCDFLFQKIIRAIFVKLDEETISVFYDVGSSKEQVAEAGEKIPYYMNL